VTFAVEIPGADYNGLTSTILLWPLATAFFLLLFGKRLGSVSIRGRDIGLAGWLAVVALGRAFVAAVVLFFDLIGTPGVDEAISTSGAHHENARTFLVHLFDWIHVGNFAVGADLLVDQLSTVMILVVTGVSTVIAVYSVGYMKGDPRYSRYFAYLTLFASAMLLLVLADNLLLLFVGWEGVGLCSYLLIGFWFERPVAANAAKKAFIVNRIGDFSFLLGVMLLAGTIGTLTTEGVNGAAAAGTLGGGIATIAALLLFGGATGKSAQIPLYVWLPDAMEGPTPASALIHAATMVTAGVYVMVRFSPVLEASGDALTVVAWVGIGSALLAALIAATQYDIKRILAYSTVSQLGYMFLAVGVGAYSAAIFHLITHAFFKALMFMGAGSVMHGLNGETDLRKMGGLKKVMPRTGWTFMIGWLAISGIIPFSGFVSKDAILAGTWQSGNYVLWALGIFTSLLTAFYMSRLYLRVFEGPLRYPEGTHPHESPAVMTIPLMILAVGAAVGGVINLPGLLTLEHFLEPAVGHFDIPTGLTAWLIAGVALLIAIGGIVLANFLYLDARGTELRGRLLARRWLAAPVGAARGKFGVDEAYGRLVVMPGKDLAAFSAGFIDRGLIDGMVNGTGRLFAGMSEGFRRVQSGYVRNYGVLFLIGVVGIISWIVLRVGAA
jgi:NADH-quinone oxidoreductase subunit L